ncbi:Vacuolar protein sorting-associated protein 41-like protein [Trichoplax sp. H2]|nr:Vacuolar protein sorting-associated protein 41-like protein [Trichoplax sp. H2]|eukprot:RDD42694.1 Vacuolar protein sorting-associated protein 41-like protein [Trichoplax sp. H2]
MADNPQTLAISEMEDENDDRGNISQRNNNEDDDEYEDDEDEDEPLFKYSQLGNEFLNIMKDRATTCFAVHTKFLAIGTDFGTVFVLDSMGNCIAKYDNVHGGAIRDISIDTYGEVIGSCSDDGKISIITVFSPKSPVVLSFDRPTKTLALAPNFARLKSKTYVIGHGDRLSLVSADWLGRNKFQAIDGGEGTVTNVRWRDRFIVWSNSAFLVKVYDTLARGLISIIQRPTTNDFRPELYPTIINWINDRRFVVGSIDSVKICAIKEQTESHKPQMLTTNMPLYFVEIVSVFKVADAHLCGLVPYEDKMAILCLPTEEAVERDRQEAEEDDDLEWDEEDARRPQLRIIGDLYAPKKKEEHSNSLPIQNFRKYRCFDYSLVRDECESQLFIVTPKDIIIAKPRDQDDHIDWLIMHENFEEALALTEKLRLQRHSVKSVGVKFVHYLITSKNYKAAAIKSVKYMGNDKNAWEELIEKFKLAQKLKEISFYVPTGSFRLDQYVYELILDDYLKTDIEGFYSLIKTWPKDLYDFETIVTAVNREVSVALQKLTTLNQQLSQSEDQIIDSNQDNSPKSANLQQYRTMLQKQRLDTAKQLRSMRAALAILYCQEGQYEDAIGTYLDLGHEDVFDLIDKYNLYETVLKHIPRLMQLQEVRAMKMLVENTDKMQIGVVVKMLDQLKHLQLAYLDKLFEKDPNIAKDHHELQVELYAEYEPKKLLHFLKKSTSYSLKKAYTICKERKFFQELVFLLDRMGNSKEALTIIVSELHDIDYVSYLNIRRCCSSCNLTHTAIGIDLKAIEFSKEKDEEELWQQLVEYSMDKPHFITSLLHNVGSHINPVMIIEKIPSGLQIPGLRDSLVKILQDYKLQISLQEGCKKILVNDSVLLFDKLTKTQRRGFYTDEFTKCPNCQRSLLLNQRMDDDVVMFFCRHAYHKDCLPARENEYSCQLCSNAKSYRKRRIKKI